MNVKTTLSFIGLLLTAANVVAQCPLRFKNSEAASVGIYIEEIKSGKKLVAYETEKTLTPASILKSVTCATALSLNGPDHEYVTDFLLVGENPSAGDADLVVVGAADPTLGSRHFKSSSHVTDSVVAHLKDKGLTYIGGDVVVDTDILPDSGVVPQWEIEDVSEYYGVGLYGVNWLDNYFENDYIIPSPPTYFKEILTEAMAMNEIAVNGVERSIDDVDTTSDTIMVYRHRSAPFREIMHSLMIRSDNLMAEGTLRSLAPGESRDSALTVEREFWKANGITLDDTRLLDGSGLSRGNSISASQIGRILTYMAKSDLAKEYVALFPIAGKEGTVRTLLSGTRLQGRMAMKSGSMSGVHCYAGYLLNKNSGIPTHTVVVMVNNFYCKRTQLKKAIENFLLLKLP